MTAQSELLLFFSTDTVLDGDVLRSFPHTIGVIHLGQAWVRKTPAKSRIVERHVAAWKGGFDFAHHQWSARHTLNSSCDKNVTSVCQNGLCRCIHCLQSRSAEPVDGLSGDHDRKPGQ